MKKNEAQSCISQYFFVQVVNQEQMKRWCLQKSLFVIQKICKFPALRSKQQGGERGGVAPRQQSPQNSEVNF